MTDLKSVSDADLFGEVARRREADLQDRIAIGKVMAKRIVKNLDALLELVPRHTKASCADNLPLFVHDGCTRCQLMEIKRAGVSEFEIDTITLKPLYRDGSALVVGPYKPPESKGTPVPKSGNPMCKCGHILMSHHGSLGSYSCLKLDCKCSGYAELKEG